MIIWHSTEVESLHNAFSCLTKLDWNQTSFKGEGKHPVCKCGYSFKIEIRVNYGPFLSPLIILCDCSIMYSLNQRSGRVTESYIGMALIISCWNYPADQLQWLKKEN